MNVEYVDGKEYRSGIEPPDLGSIQSVGPASGGKKVYRGLWEDRDKLQEYLKRVPCASVCYFIDVGVQAEYFAYNETWYYQTKSGNGGTATDITQVSDEDIDFETEYGDIDIEDQTDDEDIDFDEEWNDGN